MSLYSFVTALVHEDEPAPSLQVEALVDERSRQLRHRNVDRHSVVDAIQSQVADGTCRAGETMCPECRQRTQVVGLGDVEADYCPSCRGLWFRSGALQRLTGLADDVPGQRQQLLSRPGRLRCPHCQTLMKEHQYCLNDNVLVDVCAAHGVYAQDRELPRILEASAKLRERLARVLADDFVDMPTAD